MPRALVAIFACAAGLSVANVYYAQPLLDALADDFGISRGAAGGVVTSTQAGCALALLFLVPLGDQWGRRRLMLVQLALLTLSLLAVSTATSAVALLLGMTLVGMLGTAMTQGLIAYASSAAGEHERGRVVGATQGGVVVGLLLARVLAGGIADVAGWRGVYLASAAGMVVLGVVLWRVLPRQPTLGTRQRYVVLLASMFRLLREERTLQIRGVIALLMFMAFSIFWSALVLPLSAAPFHFSHTSIGAFGLVGAAGALAAARSGYWADRGWAQRTTGVALALLVFSWLPLAGLQVSLGWLIAGVLLLDLAGQAIHVTNQSLIFAARTDAPSRLVGAYMLFYATGSGLGAVAATATYAAFGWRGVCVLGAGVSLTALAFWAATLRGMPAAAAGRR
ncbi:membrane protein [Pandoraea horticolens]|uniref:Membrane protein n=1 Tax=Pandoraea horticolens TaxID=2508298 RepID=A0A5E4UEG5_9BURK|nr:MFS transporter [Pandoraea horticolens]VVD96599.1 membrane protein [Pandoraea horticolens]